MTTHTNYYDVLGVSKDAPIDVIKKAYNTMAKKWHPDRNQNNQEESKEKMQQISEAFSVLGDTERREIYDKHGYEGLEAHDHGGSGFDPNDIFAQAMQMFGAHGMETDNNKGVPDIQINVELSLNDAYIGKTIKKKFNRISTCSKCNGVGSKDKKTDIKCKSCKGQGNQIIQVSASGFAQVACKTCKGQGIDPKAEKCGKCNGETGIQEQYELEITIPKGVCHKYSIKMDEEGHEIPPDDSDNKKSRRTDVIIVITNANTDVNGIFERAPVIKEKGGADMADLFLNLEVTFEESISGFYKEITHMDGHKVKMFVEEPCRHGDGFVFRGEGMPKLNSKSKNTYGDLIVQLNVQHPKDAGLSKDVKSKIIKLLNNKQSKLPTNLQPTEMLTLEQYKKDALIKLQSEKMRQQYGKKSKNNCDDEDCNSDDGNFRGNQQQCPVS